ncbi:MAG: GIY-YIG nuclease family protein [Gammaproteobacteria bacterium]|nr:GIY-YIG nuclease family protein [Gammaproteobacteria bacterium]
MSDWYVYVVRCRDGSLYTGIATDLARRIREHNVDDKRGAKYTRVRRPVELVYWENCDTRSEAAKREHEIRQWSKPSKEALIKDVRAADKPA